MIAIIQARTTSKRLPGKVLMDLAGKTVIERVIERVKKAKTVDRIVVACTKHDKELIKKVISQDVDVYVGSEHNVYDRYKQAWILYQKGNDRVARITSDCALINPEVIDQMAEYKFADGRIPDYVSNTIERTFHDGTDCEIFSPGLFWSKPCPESRFLKEHVTLYWSTEDLPNIWQITNYKRVDRDEQVKLSIDTQEEYELNKKIFEAGIQDDYEKVIRFYWENK